MKTEPTDLDREAAGLFTPAPGVRAVMADPAFGNEWVVVCRVTEGGTVGGWRESSSDGLPDTWEAWGPLASIRAIDTDDPATVGVMLAQVEAADPTGLPVEIYRLTTKWLGTSYPGAGGPTRGAALVAAMRALRSLPAAKEEADRLRAAIRATLQPTPEGERAGRLLGLADLYALREMAAEQGIDVAALKGKP